MRSRNASIAAGCCLALALISALGQSLWTKLQQSTQLNQEYERPPPGMVFVPAGEFWMGSNDEQAEPDEKPLRRVFVSAFYIDKFEVTNRRFKELMPGHRYPSGEDDLPVTHVLKRDAEEFCRRAGRRLPSSAEWEKAARGTDGRVYPWGNDFRADHANINRRIGASTNLATCDSPLAAAKGKLPGGRFRKGASPYGCEDMAGNVWEWVSDAWRDKDWLGRNVGEARSILRGGAYSYSPLQARSSYQAFEALDATCNDVGFRCVLDAVPTKK